MDKKSLIVRTKRKTNYTLIDNRALKDDTLSWKAKGILAYMLSLPDDWRIYLEEVEKHATDGRTSFRSGIKELEKHGYLERKREHDENGHFTWVTYVYETPLKDETAISSHSNHEQETHQWVNRQWETHRMGNPSMENEKLLITNKQITNKQITNKQITNKQIDVEEEKEKPIDIKGIISLWNELDENIPKIISVKPATQRYKSMKARIGEVGEDKFKEGILEINKSNFLKGENNRNWRITFDWFIKPSNFYKVIEGNYTDQIDGQYIEGVGGKVKKEYIEKDWGF